MHTMSNGLMKWLLFIVLSLIWGSSFILMKAGLNGLSAVQVASIRIIASGLVLVPVAMRSYKKVPVQSLPAVFLSGTLGSLLPAYFFCLSETVIDSSLAGMLNSLTPIFAIITGALFFSNKTSPSKLLGVLVAFGGCVLIFTGEPGMLSNDQLPFVFKIRFGFS